MNWQEIQKNLLESGWLPMESAPRDVPILAFCIHGDPYLYDSRELIVYGAHVQSLSWVADGVHVLVWGGEYDEFDEMSGENFYIPDWWFRFGSNFEEPAAPIAWKPIFESADQYNALLCQFVTQED